MELLIWLRSFPEPQALHGAEKAIGTYPQPALHYPKPFALNRKSQDPRILNGIGSVRECQYAREFHTSFFMHRDYRGRRGLDMQRFAKACWVLQAP